MFNEVSNKVSLKYIELWIVTVNRFYFIFQTILRSLQLPKTTTLILLTPDFTDPIPNADTPPANGQEYVLSSCTKVISINQSNNYTKINL